MKATPVLRPQQHEVKHVFSTPSHPISCGPEQIHRLHHIIGLSGGKRICVRTLIVMQLNLLPQPTKDGTMLTMRATL